MGGNAWALVFVVLAWATFFAVGAVAHGLKVDRFPEKSLTYKVSDLRDLAKDKKAASTYVVPVLIPLDLLVMILLGASTALASLFWARSAGLPADCVWTVLVLPVAYLAIDLAEDSLLALMLIHPETITDTSARFLWLMTVLKFATVSGAAIQAAGLFAWAIGKSGFVAFWSA